jgi:hypothetical protein
MSSAASPDEHGDALNQFGFQMNDRDARISPGKTPGDCVREKEAGPTTEEARRNSPRDGKDSPYKLAPAGAKGRGLGR